jgi:hypothetical protein
MRKFLFIVIGIVFFAGALSAFGARQSGWDRHGGMSSFGASPGHRSLERSYGGEEPRAWFSDRGGRRGGGSWFNASNALDLLNALVGIIGIGLTISGMRMQRNAMQMSMRGRN